MGDVWGGVGSTGDARPPYLSTSAPMSGVNMAEMMYGSDMTRPARVVAAASDLQKGESRAWPQDSPGGCGSAGVYTHRSPAEVVHVV